MATTPEGKVKDLCKKWLKARGIWYFVPVSGGYGKHGIPDFMCCADGLTIGIEVKAAGRRGQSNRGCSALQMLVGKEMIEAGGVWVVVDGSEDLALLEEILHERRQRPRCKCAGACS